MGSKLLSLSLGKCNYNQKGAQIITGLKGKKNDTLITSKEVKGSKPSTIQVGLQMSINSSENTFKNKSSPTQYCSILQYLSRRDECNIHT